MKKKNIFTILFLLVATTAVADEKPIEVASIDKASFLRQIPPVVTEKYEYYEIRGSSEQELRSQMLKNGCTWEDGKKYDSVTSWSWTWDYGTGHTSQTCSADDFAIALEITFRLPKWVRTDDVPQPLVDKWDGYLKNLTMHENGHRDRVMDAALELSGAVARLPRALTCSDRDRKVRALNSKITAQLNEAQQAYDATTDHGAKQGALFP